MTAPASDTYFVKNGYTARPAPDYFVDVEASTGLICQPDVYDDAAAAARALGASRIIDIGCGNGYKLAEHHPEFELVGIDFGTNLETCRERYPFATWLEHDLDTTDPLPAPDVTESIVVCSDVIEHLVRPELLLRKTRRALDDGALAIFFSTPEREQTWGATHMGPPPNPHHVREWSIYEFSQLLESEGLEHGSLGLTRNNNRHNLMNNIFAALVADPTNLETVERVLDEQAAHRSRTAA